MVAAKVCREFDFYTRTVLYCTVRTAAAVLLQHCNTLARNSLPYSLSSCLICLAICTLLSCLCPQHQSFPLTVQSDMRSVWNNSKHLGKDSWLPCITFNTLDSIIYWIANLELVQGQQSTPSKAGQRRLYRSSLLLTPAVCLNRRLEELAHLPWKAWTCICQPVDLLLWLHRPELALARLPTLRCQPPLILGLSCGECSVRGQSWKLPTSECHT